MSAMIIFVTDGREALQQGNSVLEKTTGKGAWIETRQTLFEYWRGKGFWEDGEEQEEHRLQIFLSEIEVARLRAQAISLALMQNCFYRPMM